MNSFSASASASASFSISASATGTGTATATSNLSENDANNIAKQIAYYNALSSAQTSLGIVPPPLKIYNNIIFSEESLIELILNKVIELNGFGSNIYGLPGAAWYSADDNIQKYISNGSINYIHTSNESSSLYMAAYESLSSKKVGITFSTSGPGTLMAMTSIGTAFYEAVPLICFFGVRDTNFQYIDKDILYYTSKKVYYIDDNTINPEIILEDAKISVG
jgi:hypothetical protein